MISLSNSKLDYTSRITVVQEGGRLSYFGILKYARQLLDLYFFLLLTSIIVTSYFNAMSYFSHRKIIWRKPFSDYGSCKGDKGHLSLRVESRVKIGQTTKVRRL